MSRRKAAFGRKPSQVHLQRLSVLRENRSDAAFGRRRGRLRREVMLLRRKPLRSTVSGPPFSVSEKDTSCYSFRRCVARFLVKNHEKKRSHETVEIKIPYKIPEQEPQTGVFWGRLIRAGSVK